VGYLTPRWLAVYGYLLIVLIATPYLPLLIQWASSRWSAGSIPRFVLGVEISLGILLIISAGAIFFHNREKFRFFVLIIGGLMVFACLFYLVIPNPYELTHLPEYAILSILIVHAIKERAGEGSGIMARVKSNRVYVSSAMITGALGSVDELYQGILPLRYFAWRDIVLNGLGGLLGLTILWALTREQKKPVIQTGRLASGGKTVAEQERPLRGRP